MRILKAAYHSYWNPGFINLGLFSVKYIFCLCEKQLLSHWSVLSTTAVKLQLWKKKNIAASVETSLDFKIWDCCLGMLILRVQGTDFYLTAKRRDNRCSAPTLNCDKKVTLHLYSSYHISINPWRAADYGSVLNAYGNYKSPFDGLLLFKY